MKFEKQQTIYILHISLITIASKNKKKRSAKQTPKTKIKFRKNTSTNYRSRFSVEKQ